LANWHLVVAYDERATEWLSSQGYPHPAARPGNRLPTPAEIEEAFQSLGFPPNALLYIDGFDLPDSFTVRGDLLLELRVLRKLCERSGQLWVYPDCGSPALVIDATIEPAEVAAAWLGSLNADDPWREFHEKVYRV